MEKGAILSPCGLYRYQLWRIWDRSKPLVLFVMHNPSKADAEQDDPTITRCIGFAKSWGYGGLMVGNMSPYRATDPRELQDLDPQVLVPVENAQHITDMAVRCGLWVVAWGIPSNKYLRKAYHPDHHKLPSRWKCISRTQAGWPSHPLFLPGKLQPIQYTCFP